MKAKAKAGAVAAVAAAGLIAAAGDGGWCVWDQSVWAQSQPSTEKKMQLTDKEKLTLREIQVALLKAQGDMADLAARHLQAQQAAAEAAKRLQEAVMAIAKAHDCPECEITESMEIRRRDPEAKKK